MTPPEPTGDPRVVSTTGIPEGVATGSAAARPYDPLRLCIFATIALLGWLTGPVALLLFAVVGFVGYLRARRAGLLFSKCFLRDTRLVLVYLAALAALAAWGLVERLA